MWRWFSIISFHQNTAAIGDAKAYARGWQYVPTTDIERVAKCVSQFAWTPAHYQGGHRAERNFLGADLIGLDFDEGLTLEQAKNIFCDAVHVIGTTKSHRREKGGRICDRFRVILKLDEPVIEMRVYKATLAHYIVKHEADTGAGSASRFFWPCQEIVSTAADGYTQEIIQPAQQATAIDLDPDFIGCRVIPRWIDGFLKFGAPPGQRNTTCYRIGLHLTLCGFDADEVLSLVESSPISLDPEERTRATRNGIQYGQMELRRVEEEGEKIEGRN